jgi:leader peptidase (prepilin peptidase)/N-methyltransferase
LLTISLLIFGLVVTPFLDEPSLVDHFAGAIAGFLIVIGIATLYRRFRDRDGIGFDDAKLLGAIGAWVSWEGIPSVLMLATVMGLLVAAVQAIAGRRIESSTKLPLGTFLAGAGWLVWLYGPLMLGPP